MKRFIKSIACLNFVEIDGIRYRQPQDSQMCCWQEVVILAKDKSKYHPKWIIILDKELDITEVWKIHGE
jgi:hypothetical protein